MPSLAIRSFAFDDGRNELSVTFTTGRTYVYSLVPPSVAAGLAAAPSRGAYFNANIRDRFACRQAAADAATDLRTALTDSARRD